MKLSESLIRKIKTLTKDDIYVAAPNKLVLSAKAFNLFFKASGSKAKSESGQSKAVKKLVIDAIKRGAQSRV